MHSLALALLLAILIGVSLGMLGGGGSILTVPLLVYLLGYPAKPAIAMSLPVVGIASLVGAGVHWRRGNVHARTAAAFGITAMVGAFAGARLAAFVPGAIQLALLAITMIGASASMLRGGPEMSAAAATHPARVGPLLPVALAVGVLTGLVGIGGGFLVVPALVLLAGVPMHQAVGTSLVVIAMNSASAFAGYAGASELDWHFLGAFTSAAVVGVLLGTAAASHVPQAALKRGFAVLLLLVGGFVLYMNRHALTATNGSRRERKYAVAAAVTLVNGDVQWRKRSSHRNRSTSSRSAFTHSPSPRGCTS